MVKRLKSGHYWSLPHWVPAGLDRWIVPRMSIPWHHLKHNSNRMAALNFCRAQRKHRTTSTQKDSFFCRRDRDPLLLPVKNWVGVGKERKKGQEGVSSNYPLAVCKKLQENSLLYSNWTTSHIICSVEWKLGVQRQRRKIVSVFFRSFNFCNQDRALHTSLAWGAGTFKPTRALKGFVVLFNWTPKIQRELWLASSWFMTF